MKKLNYHGFAHIFIPLLFIVIIAIVGVGYMVASRATPRIKTPPLPTPPGTIAAKADLAPPTQPSATKLVRDATKSKIKPVKPYYGKKGRPKQNIVTTQSSNSAAAPPAPNSPSSYYKYAGGIQKSPGVGVQTLLSMNNPKVASSDSHSLVELAVNSADNKQAVEVGWTVDNERYHDSLPHLFVYHWVNGRGTCYDGCGFQSTSARFYPGQPMWPNGSLQRFSIYHYNGAWTIGFAGEWIGFFPDSLWTSQGVKFDHFETTQIFGEVATASNAPCTDMGNGRYGNTGNISAANPAQFVQTFYFGFGPSTWANLKQYYTDGWYYNTGGPNAFGGTWFGGAGAC